MPGSNTDQLAAYPISLRNDPAQMHSPGDGTTTCDWFRSLALVKYLMPVASFFLLPDKRLAKTLPVPEPFSLLSSFSKAWKSWTGRKLRHFQSSILRVRHSGAVQNKALNTRAKLFRASENQQVNNGSQTWE
jgi:hypothetical protein